ncbi:MAG TPA: hypothetical protein ENN87_11685, partial [Phycisphaerales bacterium]|nr:hypothetical protein [Phycisphaerales bacterium]
MTEEGNMHPAGLVADQPGSLGRLWRLQALVLGVVVLIVFVAVYFRQAGTLVLREQTIGAGGYRLRFPANPTELCRISTTPDGPMRFFLIQRQDRRLYCSAGYGDRPAAGDAEAFIEAMCQNLVEGTGGTVESETRFHLAGHPARRLHIAADRDIVIDVLLVLADQRLYEVLVATHRHRPQPALAQAILDSFQIVEPASAQST